MLLQLFTRRIEANFKGRQSFGVEPIIIFEEGDTAVPPALQAGACLNALSGRCLLLSMTDGVGTLHYKCVPF